MAYTEHDVQSDGAEDEVFNLGCPLGEVASGGRCRLPRRAGTDQARPGAEAPGLASF